MPQLQTHSKQQPFGFGVLLKTTTWPNERAPDAKTNNCAGGGGGGRGAGGGAGGGGGARAPGGWANRNVVQACHGYPVLALVWNAWGGGGEGCVCVSGQVALCDGKASWRLPCGHLPGWGFGCFGYQCGAGKNGLCRRARGGGGGLGDGQSGTWCRRAMGVLALVWNARGGGGEGCVCVSGQEALCDGKASWLLPCGHLLVGTAALVAVVWARLLCQDCASVWSLPILSLLSIAEGLLFSVVGCWLECLQ